MGKALAKRIKCSILYATETGKSETFAKRLCQIFKHAFDVGVRKRLRFVACGSTAHAGAFFRGRAWQPGSAVAWH